VPVDAWIQPSTSHKKISRKGTWGVLLFFAIGISATKLQASCIQQNIWLPTTLSLPNMQARIHKSLNTILFLDFFTSVLKRSLTNLALWYHYEIDINEPSSQIVTPLIHHQNTKICLVPFD
jgi:hypothetical protein